MFRIVLPGLLVLSLAVLAVSCGGGGSTPDPITTYVQQAPFQALPAINSAWGSPYGDLTNRGLSSWPGPDNSAIAWTYDMAWPSSLAREEDTSAVIGAQGNVHLPAGPVLVTLTADGDELWRYQAGWPITDCQPTPDGFIAVITQDGRVILLTQDGVEHLVLDTGLTGIESAAYDGDGTAFLVVEGSQGTDTTLRAIDLDCGAELWRISNPGLNHLHGTGQVFFIDGRVYVDFRPLSVLDTDGNLLWSLAPDEYMVSVYQVGPDGMVYEHGQPRTFTELGEDPVEIPEDIVKCLRIYDRTGIRILDIDVQVTDYALGLGTEGYWTYLDSPSRTGILYSTAAGLWLASPGQEPGLILPSAAMIVAQSGNDEILVEYYQNEEQKLRIISPAGETVADLAVQSGIDIDAEFLPNGNLVFAAGDFRLGYDTIWNTVCIDRTGAITWEYIPVIIGTSSVVAADGTIIAGTEQALEPPYQPGNLVDIDETILAGLLGERCNSFERGYDGWHPREADDLDLATAISQNYNQQAATHPSGDCYGIEGGAYLVCTSAAGLEKWRCTLPGETYLDPVLAGEGLVLVKDQYRINAINGQGQLVWQYDPAERIMSQPAVNASGVIYVPLSSSNNTCCVTSSAADKATNSSDWNTPSLVALSPTGDELWRVPLADGTSDQPLIDSRGRIFLYSINQQIFCYDPTGELLWSADTGDYSTGYGLLEGWLPLPSGQLCLVYSNQLVAIGI